MTEFYEGGNGPALVLLHGLGGSWHIWKPVIGLLESRYRVFAPTLPGHWGGDAWPSDRAPTVDALADALAQHLIQRGLAEAHVAGNSLGGWLALELLRRKMAASVTAFSPAGAWATLDDYVAIARRFRVTYALMPVLTSISSPFLRFSRVRRILTIDAMEHGERMPQAELATALRAMTGARILPRLLTSIGRDGPISPIRSDGVPITIAWGENDKVIPYESFGTAMVARVNGARVVTAVGCGHVPMYDDPEQIASIIDATTRDAAPAGRT